VTKTHLSYRQFGGWLWRCRPLPTAANILMKTNDFLLSLLVLYGVYGLSSGLKCWECESDKNWDGCRLLKTKECTLPMTRCGKFYTKQGAVETYRRDCFTESYCNTKPQCTSQFLKCDIDCCQGDACNRGTSKTPNLLLCLIVFFSTLMAFIIWVHRLSKTIWINVYLAIFQDDWVDS